VNLADPLELVGCTGANRVDFRVINFRPTDGSAAAAGHIQRSLRWFDFGTRPGHLQQSKAWRQGSQRVDLSSTGGHEARFDGAVDFRYKFLLKHYPLRSEEHARRKVEQHRHARRSRFESEVLGFHTQYDRLAAAGFNFGAEPGLIEWSEDSFWQDHGLLIMTDLLKSRVERGWMTAGK